MKLIEVKEALEGEVIAGADLLNIDVSIGCAADLMSDILAYASPGALLLTGLTNPQVIRTAEMKDIKAICFVRAKRPDQTIINMADDLHMILLRTNLPMFESCGRLYSKGIIGLGHLGFDNDEKE
jgi:predicted transcriptional regulator